MVIQCWKLVTLNFSALKSEIENLKEAHLSDYKTLMNRINKLEDILLENSENIDENSITTERTPETSTIRQSNPNSNIVYFSAIENFKVQQDENTILKFSRLDQGSRQWFDPKVGIFIAPEAGKDIYLQIWTSVSKLTSMYLQNCCIKIILVFW